MSRAARTVAPFPSRVLAGILLVAWAASPTHAQEVIEYYGTDALGSIRVVFDASGTVVGRTDYLPFGETFEASGNGPAEGFTGQARDGEAGLDYFHARMYQPRTGRFNAVDPVFAGLFDPQQWNRYAYARNNPLSFVDPSGLALQCVSGEELVYVDVESGAGGGRRDSVPILWNYVTCAEYGETTPDPLEPNTPTGPGTQPTRPGGPGGGEALGPGGGPVDNEEAPEAPGPNPGRSEDREDDRQRSCYSKWKFTSMFEGSTFHPWAEAMTFTGQFSFATDLLAIREKMGRPGLLGTKVEYASGLNKSLRQLGLKKFAARYGGRITPALTVTGVFTAAYDLTIATQCTLGVGWVD